jgi:hypothetical protein
VVGWYPVSRFSVVLDLSKSAWKQITLDELSRDDNLRLVRIWLVSIQVCSHGWHDLQLGQDFDLRTNFMLVTLSPIITMICRLASVREE